jgi:hypothetical protein
MEAVQTLIGEILSNISESKLQSVMHNLSQLGFEQVSDLQYLDCEKDLSGTLNTLESRKLSAKLKLHFNSISS